MTLDLIIGILLAAGFLRGLFTGFLRQAAGLAGVALAFVAAAQYRYQVGGIVAEALGAPAAFGSALGFAAIFAAIQIVLYLVVKLAESTLAAFKLSSLNRFAGGIAGAFRSAFFLSVLFVPMHYMGVPSAEAEESSVLYAPVAAVLPATWNFLAAHVEGLRKLPVPSSVKELRLPSGRKGSV